MNYRFLIDYTNESVLIISSKAIQLTQPAVRFPFSDITGIDFKKHC